MTAIRTALEIAASLLLSNVLSIAMTMFVKWFLHQWHHDGYPFATTMTCAHMALKWGFATALLKWWTPKQVALPSPSVTPLPLSRRVYWTLVVPIAVCTALDLLCSNLAMYYATVTFSTVVKSTQNVWTLIFSIFLGLQRFSWRIVAVISLICSGVALASFQSTQFDLRGFALLLEAAMLGTLQSVLMQSLLKHLDNNGAPNPVVVAISLTSPASALCLLPLVAIFEGNGLVHSKFARDSWLLLNAAICIATSGILASALVFSKVLLIRQTSALTLGISGSFRDVTLVLFAIACFGDQLGVLNWLGFAAVLSGVLSYTLLKHREQLRASTEESLESGPKGNLPATREVGGAEMPFIEVVCIAPIREPVATDVVLSPLRLTVVCTSTPEEGEFESSQYHAVASTPPNGDVSANV